jgi:hypothetical protein
MNITRRRTVISTLTLATIGLTACGGGPNQRLVGDWQKLPANEQAQLCQVINHGPTPALDPWWASLTPAERDNYGGNLGRVIVYLRGQC